MSKTKIELAQSKRREELGKLLDLEERSDDQHARVLELRGELERGEQELQAALLLESTKPEEPEEVDPARLELRNAAAISDIVAAIEGFRPLDGATAELQAETGCTVKQIPFELLETRSVEERADAATPAPTAGVGRNIAPIQPFVFAASIAPMLGIMMPSVGTGTYAVPRITTSAGAAGVADDAARDSTAGAITVTDATAKRVSARLTYRGIDVARSGFTDFEAALRRNLQAALSAQLDTYILNDQDLSANAEYPEGLIGALTAAAAATDQVTFETGIEALADLIDGLWGRSLAEIRSIVNDTVMTKYETLFQQPAGASGAKGSVSLAAYLREACGGIVAHDRMPAAANGVSNCLAFLSGDGVADRPWTSFCANWGRVELSDPWSDAAKDWRHTTAHVYCSDVKVLEAGAYKLYSIKTTA
ncbi:hypothetical protein [Candidatus Poriferisodalis sp.]|uniref:hypothetical protein n=1 Tax=Candidatus Poriferisodalis sp. TaxID=3101277 RepID=UPI003B012E78